MAARAAGAPAHAGAPALPALPAPASPIDSLAGLFALIAALTAAVAVLADTFVPQALVSLACALLAGLGFAWHALGGRAARRRAAAPVVRLPPGEDRPLPPAPPHAADHARAIDAARGVHRRDINRGNTALVTATMRPRDDGGLDHVLHVLVSLRRVLRILHHEVFAEAHGPPPDTPEWRRFREAAGGAAGAPGALSTLLRRMAIFCLDESADGAAQARAHRRARDAHERMDVPAFIEAISGHTWVVPMQRWDGLPDNVETPTSWVRVRHARVRQERDAPGVWRASIELEAAIATRHPQSPAYWSHMTLGDANGEAGVVVDVVFGRAGSALEVHLRDSTLNHAMDSLTVNVPYFPRLATQLVRAFGRYRIAVPSLCVSFSPGEGGVRVTGAVDAALSVLGHERAVTIDIDITLSCSVVDGEPDVGLRIHTFHVDDPTGGFAPRLLVSLVLMPLLRTFGYQGADVNQEAVEHLLKPLINRSLGRALLTLYDDVEVLAEPLGLSVSVGSLHDTASVTITDGADVQGLEEGDRMHGAPWLRFSAVAQQAPLDAARFAAAGAGVR